MIEGKIESLERQVKELRRDLNEALDEIRKIKRGYYQ